MINLRTLQIHNHTTTTTTTPQQLVKTQIHKSPPTPEKQIPEKIIPALWKRNGAERWASQSPSPGQ